MVRILIKLRLTFKASMQKIMLKESSLPKTISLVCSCSLLLLNMRDMKLVFSWVFSGLWVEDFGVCVVLIGVELVTLGVVEVTVVLEKKIIRKSYKIDKKCNVLQVYEVDV